MKEKSCIMQNIISTVSAMVTWFAVYYILCFVFTVCLEYEAFQRLLKAAAQHISMRNAFKLTYFLSYISATVAAAFVISRTANCKKAVYPGIITFSAVLAFLIADFVLVRLMNGNKALEETFETVIFGTKFNFASIRFNGGKIHIVSTVFRLLPLCLIYYYALRKPTDSKEK